MQEPIFNENQMLRLVEKDKYLKFMYDDLQKRGHAPAYALEVLFNSNVLEDSVYTDEYNKCLSAFEYGQRAFAKGMKCVPASDHEFLNTHIKGLKVGEGLSLIQQWIEGWMKANLTMPVDSSVE